MENHIIPVSWFPEGRGSCCFRVTNVILNLQICTINPNAGSCFMVLTRDSDM